jgi:hypothetical protein
MPSDLHLSELFETTARHVAFAERVAYMTKDGELDGDGTPWYWSPEDAHETLHALIARAREIVGLPDPVLGSTPEAAEQRTALALADQVTIEPGEYRIFRSSSAIVGGEGYPERSGQPVKVLRALAPGDEGYDTAALIEAGPMYRIQFADGVETDAFEQELQEVAVPGDGWHEWEGKGESDG